MSYSEDLKNPQWQRKRLQQLDAAKWECSECGTGKRTLEVHHCWYERDTKPWEYPDECYRVLCSICHDNWHAAKLECDKLFANYSMTQLEQAAGLLVGLNCASLMQDFEVTRRHDALFVTGLIRGWWGPVQYTNSLIDAALLKIAEGHVPFMLSTRVQEVIPCREEHSFVCRWIEEARR